MSGCLDSYITNAHNLVFVRFSRENSGTVSIAVTDQSNPKSNGTVSIIFTVKNSSKRNDTVSIALTVQSNSNSNDTVGIAVIERSLPSTVMTLL